MASKTGLGQDLNHCWFKVPEAGDEPVNTNVAGPGLSTALRLEDWCLASTNPAPAWTRGAATSWQSPSRPGHHAADLVRRLTSGPNDGKYEIIAGAALSPPAGWLDSAPALVRDVPDEAAAAMSLIEHPARRPEPTGRSAGLQRLVKEF
jgi:ParB family chromosome partitioning protein